VRIVERESLMNETKQLQHFRSMAGVTFQLGPATLIFKRNQDEGEGSYSVFELVEQPRKGLAPAGLHPNLWGQDGGRS
jgi:hypothetical protein